MRLPVTELTLLLFTLGIAAVGLQILTLEENRIFISKKRKQVRETSNYWLRRFWLSLTKYIPATALNAPRRLKPLPLPSKEAARKLLGILTRDITGTTFRNVEKRSRLLEILTRGVTLPKATLRRLFRLAKLVLFLAAIIYFTFLLYNSVKERDFLKLLEELKFFPQRLTSALEDFLNNTTTPLLAPIFRKFLE